MGEVHLHAQCSAISFYERAGFTVCGEVFDEAGIPHRAMRRRLDPNP
jgi:predicted GNAT family N-acyltransferase